MPAAADERMSVADYKHALHKVSTAYKNLKEHGKEELEMLGQRGLTQLMSVSAGLIVGAARGFAGDKVTGDVEVAGIDVDMAGGVLLTIPAMLGLFGGASDAINQFAGTVNGIVIARELERYAKKHPATAAK